MIGSLTLDQLRVRVTISDAGSLAAAGRLDAWFRSPTAARLHGDYQRGMV